MSSEISKKNSSLKNLKQIFRDNKLSSLIIQFQDPLFVTRYDINQPG